MKRSRFGIVIMVFLAALWVPARAQHAPIRNKVIHTIFRDNFREDTSGHFPAKWHLIYCNEPVSGKYPASDYWQTGIEDSAPFLEPYRILRLLAPNMNEKDYLPDSFHIEFDFFIPNAKSCAELFFSPRSGRADSCKTVSFHLMKGSIHFASAATINPDFDERYPSSFDYSVWHHFAFVFKRRKVDCYLDDHHLLSINNAKFVPGSFSLGCVPPVKFRNVVAGVTEYLTIIQPIPATTAPIPASNELDKIITDNKIITHDIHFDVNKSTVKHESMPFINDLAAWLKENATVKLRIDGHTDSDGRPASNMILSQERADAVKTLLVAAGVETERITTMGFGATMPIESNATKEGKAMNRRVEFLKQ